MAEIGVYKITNLVNGKFYIGSSQDIKRRWYLHKWELIGNKHHSITLQRSWNKYGSNNFEFEIIELCDVNDLFSIEQLYLDKLKPYDSSIGFNISNMANGVRGIKRTDEQRKAMSKIRKGKHIFLDNPVAMANKLAATRRGKAHPMFGKKLSPERLKNIDRTGCVPWNKGVASDKKNIPRSEDVKRKISITKNNRMKHNKSCKLSKENVSEIKILLSEKSMTKKDISILYRVDPSTISNIKTNKRWNNTVY